MKYKVWDSKDKNWDNENDFFINPKGKLYLWDNGVIEECIDSLIVVYSAEKYDKNGVELFSGDLLKNNSDSIFEIYFDEQYSQWCVVDEAGNTDPLNEPDGMNDFYKIGNKYENPELY